MTRPFATVAGERVTSAEVHVPYQGPWFADVDFEGNPDVSGQVTITLGELELVGTVDARYDGTRGLQRRTRVVAGAGGWATLLEPKAYHNDGGVKALLLAQDAARAAGETLGSFNPATPTVGVDYVRRSGPASRTLEGAAGGAPWWVAYDGTTHVGERASSTPATDSYEVLDYDSRGRLVTLAVDDLRSVGIGSVLSEGLDAPQTVRELTLVVTPEEVRVVAWCGEQEAAGSRLAGLIRSLVERITDERLWGLWRYRVVRMSSDRVELQSVRQRVGLPDILPIAMWPGVAGAHAELAPGAEVLVEFIEGDRAQPVITHFAGKAGPGFVPTKLALANGTKGAARVDDEVEVTIPTGTFLVAATAGVLNPSPVKVTGKITAGSSKVVIG